MKKIIQENDIVISDATREQFEGEFPWDIKTQGQLASWYYFQDDLVACFGEARGTIFGGNANEI